MPHSWVAKVLTMSESFFPGPLAESVTGNGIKNGIWDLECYKIADDIKRVDDTAYGGGSGMVMKPNIIADAIEKHFDTNKEIIYLSPRGELFSQNIARELVKQDGVQLICARFEGIDERAIHRYNMREISIGDYVLSGGDIAAYVVIDACVRLLPGILGNSSSVLEESFGSDNRYQNLLEYPHYTKPRIWQDMAVPDVLLSGDHEKINEWRLQQAESITKLRRYDSWLKHIHKELS